MTDAQARPSFGDVIRNYLRDFNVLKETGREYWGIQIINILDCTIYFALLTVASLYLSKDLGLSDEYAGYVIAAFTSTTTLFLMFSGMMTDWLGIKRSLRLSMLALLVLRLGLVACGLLPDLPHRAWIAAGLFFLMAPFMAMVQTSFQAANKRFTTKRSRSAGFTLWYLFMNIGATLAGFSVDIVKIGLGLPRTHIFTMGAILAVLSLLAIELLIHREEQVRGADEEPEEETAPAPGAARRSPLQIMREVMSESAFWKLTVLVGLLLGVRAVFAYFYLLMPKYWERVIGADAYIGTLNAINPIIIVVGLILFIPIANRFNLFKMLTYGAAVSAASLFVFVVPWRLFSDDRATAHYLMAILSISVLSVGEIIWSPKLSEYTAAVAPKGQEGTYLGFTMMPWFLAKTVVSALSGHMLARWSPEGIGEKMLRGEVGFWEQPAAMWLILGLAAAGGVALAILLKPWFTKGARWEIEGATPKA